MSGSQVNEIYSRVIEITTLRIVDTGYLRRGSSLRKTTGKNVAIIQFQKSQKSSTNSIFFTINLAVICGALLEFDKLFSEGAGISDAHFRQRIGMLLLGCPDKWWEIDSDTDASSMIEEVSSLVKLEVVPCLERYLDDNELVIMWKSGRSPGLTDTQRSRYLARLNSMKEYLR